MVAIMNKHNLHHQKVVILPVLVTTHLPYTFILPCFSFANLVQRVYLKALCAVAQKKGANFTAADISKAVNTFLRLVL